MNIWATNEKLIGQASKGDMKPLLDRLSEGVVMSVAVGSHWNTDATYPDDPIWPQVNAAINAGVFTDAQIDQIDAAVDG